MSGTFLLLFTEFLKDNTMKIYLTAFILSAALIYAQASANDSLKVSYPKLSLVGATIAAGGIGAYYVVQTAWWSEESVPFHFDDGEDLEYVKNIDKFGHFFGGYVAQDLYYHSLLWSNVSSGKALWYSFGLSTTVQILIDIKDAYSPLWGFSAVDVLTGTAGAGYRALQYKYPVLQDYNFKMTYYYKDNTYAKTRTGIEKFIEDYPSQTYWFTAPINNFLPAKAAEYIPDYLGLAVGLSIDDYKTEVFSGRYQAYISLDVDLEKLVKPYNNKTLSTVAHYLNFIKIPAPALKFQPYLKGYPIYF